jgi:predicted DNA-binding transcriptional regulator AlpA
VTPLISIEQLAEDIQVPVPTLYKWRAKSYGPVSIKVGKYIRYRPEAIDAWLASLEPESNVTPIRRRA